jgi:RNA polymerase sigma factor (sigma-70 family)
LTKRLHGQAWRHALVLFRDGALGDVSDEQLVEQFLNGQGAAGEGAFEVLLERHGPMVFRICRTILRDRHDAEDAFQATFLVLARQARTIRHRASLASWLHGVARRVACHARSAEYRRRRHEQRVAGLADPCVIEPRLDDLAEVVHAEVDSLPERYRAAVVLCDIEGLTEGQAARRLGRPVGTIRSQLSRGRQYLRRRLIHRGLAPAVALFALTHAALAAERIVPLALASSTVERARKFAVAQTVTGGVVGSAAGALAEGFLRRLIMVRIQLTAIVALGAIAIATAGAFALDRQGDKPTPPPGAKEEILALVHAWEKAVIDGDVGTMDRLLAYELVGTDPEGWIWDKTKYLDHVKRRAQQVAAVDLKDIRIQVYGDAAVEIGIGVGHYDQAKPPWIAARGHITERFTRTWIKRHGTWQCVAYQTMVTERAEDPVAGNTPPAGKTDSPGTARAEDAVPLVDHFFHAAKAAVAGARENRR